MVSSEGLRESTLASVPTAVCNHIDGLIRGLYQSRGFCYPMPHQTMPEGHAYFRLEQLRKIASGDREMRLQCGEAQVGIGQVLRQVSVKFLRPVGGYSRTIAYRCADDRQYDALGGRLLDEITGSRFEYVNNELHRGIFCGQHNLAMAST